MPRSRSTYTKVKLSSQLVSDFSVLSLFSSSAYLRLLTLILPIAEPGTYLERVQALRFSES